jgi:hypothetical protein
MLEGLLEKDLIANWRSVPLRMFRGATLINLTL